MKPNSTTVIKVMGIISSQGILTTKFKYRKMRIRALFLLLIILVKASPLIKKHMVSLLDINLISINSMGLIIAII